MANVYFFGSGKAEGSGKMKDTLGGKGANLAEMTNLGIPVPPGFTISTDVCKAFYDNNNAYPESLDGEVKAALGKLENIIGKKLGSGSDPLLVSVRSGAAVSMPGMMDTILNLGLNDKSVLALAKKSGNARFAWDSYRRFIQMYGDVVLGIDHDEFEKALSSLKSKRKVKEDTELKADDLQSLVQDYKKIVKHAVKKEFPQDPIVQLWGAIDAVFGSWMNARAIKYRELNGIKNLKGTAVNVQAMVFGNFGDDSGTGVCFSRDPSTGKKEFYGDYLINAQGEDVVAGIRTPLKLRELEKRMPKVYGELVAIKDRLENHFHDMQDMEFTVESGKLFLLQTRNGKRSGAAAVKCALDMVGEGMIDKKEAILRVSTAQLDQLLHPNIDAKAVKTAKPLTKGLDASPGAAVGRIVFTAEDAEKWAADGEKVILVRSETSPEDIAGMNAAQGILTATGGRTSHAAVVARGMGKPCVAGAKDLEIAGEKAKMAGKTFKKGDVLTIDGSTGNVYEGALPLVEPKITKDMGTFLSWCDEVRDASDRNGVKGFRIRTNADEPKDAARAFEFGADGVGLCRTEHMFFDPERLPYFQAMIICETPEERKRALKKILPFQKKDFQGIFKAMNGKPVTIRLLDPPLHEFLPKTKAKVDELAKASEYSPKELQAKIDKLHEQNPMLGHRGCRLAMTYPEIYDMQVEAIGLAAADCLKKNIPVHAEIMIPIVCGAEELAIIRPRSEKIWDSIQEKAGLDIPFRFGTMIEVPRAAILAGEVAKFADFFSFGTNDLTQMTFAFSRDDAGSFLPTYLERNALEVDPFLSIDEKGVGALINLAIKNGRETKGDLKCGICGEQGGDPATIDFCYRSGLSYVSCSPFRVPLARLAGAQAVIRN